MRTLLYGLSAVALALIVSACGGDPVAGDDCGYQETGNIFCAEGGKVLECTFVDAERRWREVATCPDGTSCQTTDDFRGFACE